MSTDKKPLTIVWFRQDLRLKDNPALSFAAERGLILPIYIFDQDCPAHHKSGGASNWWLHHSLSSLNGELHGTLRYFAGKPIEVITKLVEQTGAQAVVWNRCYEGWQIERDKAIKQSLIDAGISAKSFNGSLLWEPWQVLKGDGTPYKVFTPYYRKGCLSKAAPRLPLGTPEHMAYFDGKLPDTVELNAMALLPTIAWDAEFSQQWQPGEIGAADKLSAFLHSALVDYKDQRNVPSVAGTSQLSPHLHFGEVSPNQIWYAAIDARNGNVDEAGLDCYLSELGWREFSYYLLYHFPQITNENFNKKFDAFPWRRDEAALTAWQCGNTGIPIVDAGMRELWRTGYMHNRVRMIVGSFLVKNLLLDWRLGERWFWDCLLDADTASNSASWQWVAGSGADAAPYFRVFNPVLQGEKFDKQGEYVKRYCPELSALPPKYIHQPWAAPEHILKACRIELGQDYPAPIVDLKVSRQRALDAFAKMKEA